MRKPATNITQANEKGKNIFQPSLISWSYLYLGKAARTQINPNNNKHVLVPNQKPEGMKLSSERGASQPPRNIMEQKLHINIILAYSPRKNKAKAIAEYSTLYPATSSASASGKSNGARFVSARIETKNIKNKGNKGTMYQTFS